MAINFLDLAMIFLMGLAGSVHCVAMCGGIAGMLGSQSGLTGKSPARLFTFHLAYNVGRITSYVIAGVIVGLLGKGIALAGQNAGLPDFRNVIIAIFTLFLGAYLLGWTVFLLPLEKAGQFLWAGIEPVARKLLPVKTPGRAFITGMLWGWLPCGMVYVALSWSGVSTSPLRGGLLMAAFGLGTLPSMLGMGLAGSQIRKFLANPSLRAVVGVVVMLSGLYLLSGLQSGTGSHFHH